MTQEDKELLLKDLCARWLYGTIVSVTDGTIKYDAYIESVSYKNIQVSPVSDSNFTAYTFYKISEIKPYLRPVSSMTEEEYVEYSKLWNLQDEFPTDADIRFKIDVFDWLNKHYFDYRGLIKKGLAIEVTEENNPYKE